jgi:hypothetical protein
MEASLDPIPYQIRIGVKGANHLQLSKSNPGAGIGQTDPATKGVVALKGENNPAAIRSDCTCRRIFEAS